MSTELGTYWEERAVRFGDVEGGLPAVCSYGMPLPYNEAIQACQSRALAPLLAAWGGLDILDAGCGVGRWSVELAKRGNRVVGLDLSATMVALARKNAREAGVDCEFAVGDVAVHRSERRFDVILTVTVLQHVMDDAAFGVAVRNLASQLKPSGSLVLLEVAPTHLTRSCDSAIFRARTLAAYRSELGGAGLAIERVHGVDAKALRTLSLAAMRRLPTKLARALVASAAPLALPLDLVVSRLRPDACWHKVIVAKRAG